MTPDSPAFVVLGVSPTEIQRPTSPKAFAAAMLPAFVADGNLVVPTSFALEAAPYWWRSNPSLTLAEYARPGAANLIRTATLSIASTRLEPQAADAESTDSVSSRLAFGVRTSVAGPSVDDQALDECEKALTITAVDTGAAMIVAARNGLLDLDDPDAVDRFKQDLELGQSERLELETQRCEQVVSSGREGFLLDLAGGLYLAVPDNQLDAAELGGVGAWLNAGYVWRSDWSLLGLARYLERDLETDASAGALDLGLKGHHAWSQFSTALEAIVRVAVGDDGSSDLELKVDMTFEYALNADLVFIATVGRDYAPVGDWPLLSIGGLKWSADFMASRIEQ